MEARTALVLTVACLAAAALLPSAAGHGFMYQPAARNVSARSFRAVCTVAVAQTPQAWAVH